MERKDYGKLVAIKARANSKLENRDIKALNFLCGKLILDVGCGSGVLSSHIQKNLNAKVIGVDFSPAALKVAKSKGIECYKIDIEEGLPDKWKDKFDSVIISEVLEHIFDTDFVIEQIKKVLKPDGILVLTIPNICRLPYRGLMMFGYAPRFAVEYRATGKEAGHIRAFDIHRIKNLLEDHKFKIEKINGDVVNFMIFKSSFLANIFPNLANTLILKARK